MNDSELIAACLKAWGRSPGAMSWPTTMDTLLVADLKGQPVFWPSFEGESFDIVRLSDSTIVDEEELPDPGVLTWRVVRLPVPRHPLL
jgi:hypothetical protein